MLVTPALIPNTCLLDITGAAEAMYATRHVALLRGPSWAMDFKTRFKGKISLEHPLAKKRHGLPQARQNCRPLKSRLLREKRQLSKETEKESWVERISKSGSTWRGTESMRWRPQQPYIGEAIHESKFQTFTRKPAVNVRSRSNRLKINPSSFSTNSQVVEDVSDTTTEEEPLKPKRRIYYKPYRLKNLKALPQVRELPKGIGPKEVPTQQIERREHMLSYASRVWSRNKLTKKRVKKVKTPKKKSKYEIAREFAKTVPKPKPRESSKEDHKEKEESVERTFSELELLALKNEDARRQIQLLGLNF